MITSYQGNLIIVAAPSGGGKTSLVKKLVTGLDDIAVSVSHTTRSMQKGEKNGGDYFFVSEHEFLTMVNEGAFIEYASVFGHYYGTSIAQIKTRLDEGIDVVLDIDWQGAQQIKQLFPDSISIFIVPPSLETLRERLFRRRRDDEKTIQDRMSRAQAELSHYAEFDYLVVNDDFDEAVLDLQSIVVANRLSLSRQTVKQRKLLSFLLTSQ